MTLKQTHFELGLLISHAFFFQVFNATNNLKVTGVFHWFLGLNKNLTELKSDKVTNSDKSLVIVTTRVLLKVTKRTFQQKLILLPHVLKKLTQSKTCGNRFS